MGRKSFTAMFLALALAWLGTGCTPSGPKALLQGADLVRKGKYEAAITKLKIATDLMRSDARAWNYLGLAYHGAGQSGEAMIAYQRAQLLDQNLAEARYNLGVLYLEQGNPVSAAEELTIFTALQPKSVAGWVKLGDAHLQNRHIEPAQTSYYTALNITRDVPEAYNGIGLILLQRQKPEDAYRFFMEANKYDSNYAPAILNMAVMAHQHLDAFPTALTKYREYLKKAPNAPNVAAVEAAVRQLDEVLNPRPKPVELPVEIAETKQPEPVVTNEVAKVVVATNPPPVVATNAVVTARTNATTTTTAAAARTRSNVTAVASSTTTRTNAPATPPKQTTNKPPVQVAKVDPPKESTAREPKELKETVAPKTNTPPTTAETKPEEKVVPKEPEKPKVAAVENTPEKPPESKPAEPKPEEKVEVAKAEPPVTPQPAPEENEPPLEDVKVEETTIAPAADIVVAANDLKPSEPLPKAEPKVELPPEPPAKPAPVQPQATQESAEEKRGFFKRMNPVNLFRGDKSEPELKRSREIVTPLPPDDSAPTPTVPLITSLKTEPEPAETKPEPAKEVAKAEPAEVTPMPVSTSVARYQYGRIKKPSAGDRAAAERLFQRGIGAQQRNDPASAATFFTASAETDSTYFAAQYNLGLVAYSSGQWFKALSAFETALVLEPAATDARYNFALTLQKAGFVIDAARELEKVIAQNPRDVRSRLLLGNVYAQNLGDISGARDQYRQVLALEPQHPQATAIRYWLAQHP